MSRSEIREAAARFANSEESVAGREEKDEEQESEELVVESVFPTVGSGNFASDFGLFDDDLREELAPPTLDENYDCSSVYLWNF